MVEEKPQILSERLLKNKVELGYISYLFHKAQKRNQAKHPSRISKRAFEPGKNVPSKIPFHFDLSPLLYSFSPQHLNLPGVFHLQALERAPISLGNSFPIHSPPHFPCKLNHLNFQLASPPSIHMGSWWAACNLCQGPKWTHNTAQGRAGAYGLEPNGFWAPKSQKIALHTSWPD